MKKVIISMTVLLVLFMMTGCQSSSNIKKGDRFSVTADFQASAETQWVDQYTDGFSAVIPNGTVLEALYSSNSTSKFFECKAIAIAGNIDENAAEETFVPAGIRTRVGYKGYAFAIKKELIGTKLKRL